MGMEKWKRHPLYTTLKACLKDETDHPKDLMESVDLLLIHFLSQQKEALRKEISDGPFENQMRYDGNKDYRDGCKETARGILDIFDRASDTPETGV